MSTNELPIDMIIVLATALGSTVRLLIRYIRGVHKIHLRKAMAEILVVSALAHAIRSIRTIIELILISKGYATHETIEMYMSDRQLMYGLFSIMGVVHKEIIIRGRDISNQIGKSIKSMIIKKAEYFIGEEDNG